MKHLKPFGTNLEFSLTELGDRKCSIAEKECSQDFGSIGEESLAVSSNHTVGGTVTEQGRAKTCMLAEEDIEHRWEGSMVVARFEGTGVRERIRVEVGLDKRVSFMALSCRVIQEEAEFAGFKHTKLE